MLSPSKKRASTATSGATSGMSSADKQSQTAALNGAPQNIINDPRVISLELAFPLKKPSGGLKPLRTYQGEISIEVAEAVDVKQLNVTFEGWERVDFGGKAGTSRRPICRSTEDLLQTSSAVVDTIVGRRVFRFTLSTPNVNFPAAMDSAICEISYSLTATLVGASNSSGQNTTCANNIGTLASSSVGVQMAPRVLASGVGWLKPLVMRDGVMLEETTKRRFRRQAVLKAMNICVQVRNHCCTLGEAIAVDVDATMLQSDRVLTFVRAAVIEQVALKTSVQDAEALAAIHAFLGAQGTANSPTVILAERTLNRKVSEIDPSMLTASSPAAWGASADGVGMRNRRTKTPPLVGLSGIQNLHIRVPRKDVCTADGFILGFSHVLRLTFGLTSRPSSSGIFDTKYATKDIPLRLVTSKFGDVGRASQAEINKRLSALTMESDGGAVSEAYGYLLSENSRALRPESLESFGCHKNVPTPILLAVSDALERQYTPLPRPTSSCKASLLPASTSQVSLLESAMRTDPDIAPVLPESPDRAGFQYGPLPPIPQPKSEPQPRGTSTNSSTRASTSAPDTPNPTDHVEAAALPQEMDADRKSVGGDNDSRVDDAESSALYMAVDNDASTSWSADEEKFHTCRQQRDTLVEADRITASSQQQTSSLQSFHSFDSLHSYTSSASAHSSSRDRTVRVKEPSIASNPQDSQGSDTLSAQNSASSLDNPTASDDDACETAAERKIRSSDKRESAQSQSETIICSPSTEQHDVFDKCVTSDPKVPELKLIPSIPIIRSLDEMTRDFFGTTISNSDYFG
ncbi:hypothetical protein LPJ72_000058 [Coemansia sp. Benny D160-2]|nr:hypothetical protein LPJ72_000058 [Coemansia sp. Benny D160-2]